MEAEKSLLKHTWIHLSKKRSAACWVELTIIANVMFHIFTETVLFCFFPEKDSNPNPSVCLSGLLSFTLSFFIFFWQSGPSIRLSVCLSVYLSVCLSFFLFLFVFFVLLNYGILFQMRSKQNSLLSHLVNLFVHWVSTITIKTSTSSFCNEILWLYCFELFLSTIFLETSFF